MGGVVYQKGVEKFKDISYNSPRKDKMTNTKIFKDIEELLKIERKKFRPFYLQLDCFFLLLLNRIINITLR